MTVRRLLSSCATKLAVLFASSRLCERDSGSLAMAACSFCAREPRVDFFRAIALVAVNNDLCWKLTYPNGAQFPTAAKVGVSPHVVPTLAVYSEMPPILRTADFQAMVESAPE